MAHADYDTTAASRKQIATSDKMARRYTSPKSDFGDDEYASSDDNYDLIIGELDYINKKIAAMERTPKSDSAPRKQRRALSAPKDFGPTDWLSYKDLKVYFPNLTHYQISCILADMQPSMPTQIKKRWRSLALRFDALTEFAKIAQQSEIVQQSSTNNIRQKTTKFHTGIKNATHKTQTGAKKNMVYFPKPKTK